MRTVPPVKRLAGRPQLHTVSCRTLTLHWIALTVASSSMLSVYYTLRVFLNRVFGFIDSGKCILAQTITDPFSKCSCRTTLLIIPGIGFLTSYLALECQYIKFLWQMGTSETSNMLTVLPYTHSRMLAHLSIQGYSISLV